MKTENKALGPADRPKPNGFDAAERLYNQMKYPLAAKEFEKIIKSGVADVNTHAYLAACYFNERQYTKARQEFSWVAKNATGQKNFKIQRDAENSARALAIRMAGICPGNCLKDDDPRWAPLPGKPPGTLWIKFNKPHGWDAWSKAHVGQVVEYVDGVPTNKGTCPICNGTGRVVALKNGDPRPW